MARFENPTDEQVRAWNDWVASRPEAVRLVAERFDPWTLYRMKSTGQRVTVESFGVEESGRVSLTVHVSGDFNLVTFEREVFGIDPGDLEPCELPAEGETLGAVNKTREGIDQHIDELRLSMRPDLWKAGPSGKAVPR